MICLHGPNLIPLTNQVVHEDMLCCHGSQDPAFANWGVTITLALPHLLYAWIWLRPGDWLSLFGKKNAVEAFAHAAYFGKGDMES
jgi:hypothetical protein